MTAAEPVTRFADELMWRLAYTPHNCPPGLRISDNFGANGHGGPGHQDEPTDDCGTPLGRVCYRGALVHVGEAIYRIDRYHALTHEWSAHWPD